MPAPTSQTMLVPQLEQLLDAFLAALKDEIAAAKSIKGDSITSLSDGRRSQRTADHSVYTFLMDRSVAASDDVPVELEVGGHRYKGSVLYINGDEIAVVVNTPDDLGREIVHAGLVTNLAFLPEHLRDRLKLVRTGKETIDAALAQQVFLPDPRAAATIPTDPALRQILASLDGTLNPSQRHAVISTQQWPVSFVWGPPGTGKTHTLARIAETFLRRGMRILVVAHSNVAVDEVAQDIAVLLRDTPWYDNYEILRLGHHRHESLEQYDRLLFDRYAEMITRRLGSDRTGIAEAQRMVLDRAKILCTTLTQVFFSPLFPETPFDACIVDEASMAPLPALFWALTRAYQHAVIGGDFLQLPPVALAQTPAASRWLGRNLYQHLGITTPAHARNDPRVFLLDTQYRMHPKIAEIPNRLFYQNLLRSDPGTGTQSSAPTTPLALVNTSQASPWCVRIARGSRINLHHAHVAALLAAKYAGTPPVAGRVAILTPYAAQARLIGAFIRDHNLARAVRVATVHRFQGGEVPVTIIDTCESPPERPAPMIDDLNNDGARLLLNVAMTRPKETLVVIANADYLNRALDDDSSLVKIIAMVSRTGAVLPSTTLTDTGLVSTAQLETDIGSARHEILAVIPAEDARASLTTALDATAARGVHVTIHNGHRGPHHAAPTEDKTSIVTRLPRLLVVIDRRIIWDGLQENSPGSAPGHARRLVSPQAAASLLHSIVATSSAPGPDGKPAGEVVQTEQACPECGGRLQAIIGGPHVMLLCERAPECGLTRRLWKKDRLPTNRTCPSCGAPMFLLAPFGSPFLGCSRHPRCKKSISLGRGHR